MKLKRRSRQRILLLLTIIILIGIWSRVTNSGVTWTGKAFGDTLWATMFYLWLIFLAPRIAMLPAVAISLGIAFAIEFLKLYHASWIESLRGQRLMGFLLGHAFYKRDFLSYVAGTMLGLLADLKIISSNAPR